MASSCPPWSELPADILGLVIDCLPSATGHRRNFWSAASLLRTLQDSLARFRASSSSRHLTAEPLDRTADSHDRAHFRAAYRSWCTADPVHRARFQEECIAQHTVSAVCRSWRAVARAHLPCPPRHLPWIVRSFCYFRTSSDTRDHRLPSIPEDATCIGSTDDWIALCCVVVNNTRKTNSYLLHNPFSETTVALPELDALIGNNVSLFFMVRKVLMRSTPHDVVALLTNNYNCPIILVRPGKGVWLPRPRSAPFVYIVDIVFIGDRLYGITKAEDLISLDIAFGADGTPIVTRAKRVIRHLSKAGDRSDVWSNMDILRVWPYPPIDDGYDLWSDVDEKYHKCVAKDKSEQDGETLNGEHYKGRSRYEMIENTINGTISEDIHYNESDDLLTSHIVESLGKLLMVRRKLHQPPHSYTGSIYVYEADITTGAWVPVTNGLHGQALFISSYFCKSVHACGEVQKDSVYFAETGEVVDMRSMIISQPQRDLLFRYMTWLFPPEPVVYTI